MTANFAWGEDHAGSRRPSCVPLDEVVPLPPREGQAKLLHPVALGDAGAQVTLAVGGSERICRPVGGSSGRVRCCVARPPATLLVTHLENWQDFPSPRPANGSRRPRATPGPDRCRRPWEPAGGRDHVRLDVLRPAARGTRRDAAAARGWQADQPLVGPRAVRRPSATSSSRTWPLGSWERRSGCLPTRFLMDDSAGTPSARGVVATHRCGAARSRASANSTGRVNIGQCHVGSSSYRH